VKENQPNSFLKYSGLGLQLLLSIGLAAWVGVKLDRYLELKFPAFLLLLVFSAFAGSMYILYRSLNKE
jgi:Putative F0F1-ATPase subunit Ca2+/Mg2+ transporter